MLLKLITPFSFNIPVYVPALKLSPSVISCQLPPIPLSTKSFPPSTSAIKLPLESFVPAYKLTFNQLPSSTFNCVKVDSNFLLCQLKSMVYAVLLFLNSYFPSAPAENS